MTELWQLGIVLYALVCVVSGGFVVALRVGGGKVLWAELILGILFLPGVVLWVVLAIIAVVISWVWSVFDKPVLP